MKKLIQLIAIDRLKSHERTMSRRVGCLVREIKAEGNIRRPIIVDQQSMVVLDGHHRVEALRRIGAARIPVHFVDYLSPNVRVYLRRKYLNMHMIKQAVLYSGITGRVYPMKTTRHLISKQRSSQKILLKRLLKGGE